ncbi:MAG: 30S ribosomal protein S6 [Candidatus Magasanikbacteria bacterium]|uniref:Small ribosomal subunit protein bS6 n=1 Tax=Candidatus Magasanikbacteria bacterium CG10_big_fil_rev_8_21_14_0_10_38_6 TaxID=1974647 RepID=A0A2M6P2E3_9BACT|nr:30S ribosomal protein S6 [Candidatus Magasanikbacteria bacterium]NCS72084.1 30S ribosomal protein S6 [Candidatus Magasanikbacteria bacterium]PIR77729.1 MAG: 30S ribosomal protein S6 [Candidatus Magasanikbacteria bacterium CG10_big_fil_rev_8_21_14_0_10_38_6]
MKQYELLCVLRGTLSEDEIAPLMEKVSSIITTQEGVIISANDMGKRRIAYPIKHIRYGYFHLVYFDAPSTQTPHIQEKLRLIPEILRGIVRVRMESTSIEQPTVGAVIDEIVRHDDLDRSDRKEKRHKKVDVSAAPAVETTMTQEGTASSSSEEEVMEEKEEADKEPSISMKDIDKKLDEILQSDLDNV